MATVTITGNTYFVYATVGEADAYLIPSTTYTTWSALSTDDKAKFLVMSARFLDGLKWLPDWDTQAEREATEAIVNASIEIAGIFSTGETSWIGGSVPTDPVKRLKAGSAEIEYQSTPWFLYRGVRWPSYILLLLRPYLIGNNTGVGGAKSFGTDGVAGPSNYLGNYGLVQ